MQKKAVTLIELLIATSLLGFVILAATSIDLFTRRRFQETDVRANLLNEISPVMEHMVKNIMQGVGDLNRPGVIKNATQEWIKVRWDRNLNGLPDDNNDVPGDWIAYRYIPEQNQIQYHRNYPFTGWPTTGGEVIARKVINAMFTLSGISLLEINIAARQDPTQKQDPIANPQVSLQSRVQLRSTSIR